MTRVSQHKLRCRFVVCLQGVSCVNSKPIVFIVDDDLGVRRSLQHLIRSVCLECRTYPSASDFLAEFDASTPGCMVVDVRLNGMSGFDLQEELVRRGSSLPIIMITGFGDVQMAVRAMRAGAVDFIEKPFSHQILLDRVHEALTLDAGRRRTRAEQDKWQRRLSRLSKRQRQVLELIVEGKSTIEVARCLGLSRKTVYSHRSEALDRIDASTVAEVAQHVFAAKAS